MKIESKEQAKSKAAALRKYLATQGLALNHRKSLDAIAVTEGLPNWNTMAALLPDTSKKSTPVTNGAEAVADFTAKTVKAQQRLLEKLTAYSTDSNWLSDVLLSFELPKAMAREVFLKLSEMEIEMGLAGARGEDCIEGFDDDFAEIAQLLAASPWTLHPDHGCVLQSTVAQLDDAANEEQIRREDDAAAPAEDGAPVKWDIELVRVGYGHLEVVVEADSLEEALTKAEQEASDTYISESNYDWSISSISRKGVALKVPDAVAVPDSVPMDYAHVERVSGRARYKLRVCREGVGFASWEVNDRSSSADEVISTALDNSGSLDASEKESNYLIDVLNIEPIAAA